MKKQPISRARWLACTAVMSAVAAVLMYLEFSVPFVPEFLKFDFSETPALIASFSLGPVSGIVVCLVKNILHLPVTMTAGVGELSNFILGVCLVLPAGLLYRRRKNRLSALCGAAIGALLMAGVSMLTNYYIIYPVYAKIMPMESILTAYAAICPPANTLWKALAIFNLPFTFIKGVLGAAITFALYKPLSPLIKGYSSDRRKRGAQTESTAACPDDDCKDGRDAEKKA